MSDARWFDVRAAASSSAGHFAMAVAIHAAGGFDGPSLEAYKGRMAFMHAMQAGHRSLESTLERIMAMLGETIPTGPQSHSDLIRRAGRSIEDDAGARPAILPPDLATAAEETRRFRHRATHDYDNFDIALSQPSLDAAKRIADGLLDAVEEFRGIIDPPGVGR